MKITLPRNVAPSSRLWSSLNPAHFFTTLKAHSVPAHSDRSELLDAPDIPVIDLVENFRDIKLINRWFGGVSLVEKSLRPMLPSVKGAEIRLLDLAAGVADIPLALARRWRKRYRVKITAIDLNTAIVELARQAAAEEGVTDFETHAADVFTYPFAIETGPPYDFVTCSLAFHHFGREKCLEMLRLMAALARYGFVVNDLERSWFGYLGAHLLGLTLTRHRLTRHDAPLSVLRAFTPAEFAALVDEANLGQEFRIEVKKGSFSRMAIVGQRIC